MDARVTSKLVQDKVSQFLKQMKAAAESDGAIPSTTSSQTTNIAAGVQSAPATAQHALIPNVQSSTNITQQGAAGTNTSVTAANTGMATSASTPALPALTTDTTANTVLGISAAVPASNLAVSMDSGFVKSETNDSSISSQLSEAGGSSLFGSQQVPAPNTALSTMSSNHSPVSQPGVDGNTPSTVSTLPSNSMIQQQQSQSISVAGSTITSQQTLLHQQQQSLPVAASLDQPSALSYAAAVASTIPNQAASAATVPPTVSIPVTASAGAAAIKSNQSDFDISNQLAQATLPANTVLTSTTLGTASIEQQQQQQSTITTLITTAAGTSTSSSSSTTSSNAANNLEVWLYSLALIPLTSLLLS